MTRQGNQIRTSQRSTTGIIAALAIGCVLARTAIANEFSISPAFVSTGYVWEVSMDGAAARKNPTLYLTRGQAYTFNVSNLAGFHSFYINTASGLGSANAYTGGGLSANGVTSNATITFDVPDDAPDALYYNCGIHAPMAGKIDIVIFRGGFD